MADGSEGTDRRKGGKKIAGPKFQKVMTFPYLVLRSSKFHRFFWAVFEAPNMSFDHKVIMAMNDFFESSHIVESLYSDSADKVSASAFKSLPKVKECLNKGDIYSSDCRLAVSKLITANANAMYVAPGCPYWTKIGH